MTKGKKQHFHRLKANNYQIRIDDEEEEEEEDGNLMQLVAKDTPPQEENKNKGDNFKVIK